MTTPMTDAERNKLIQYLMNLQFALWIPMHRESRETIQSYDDKELLRQIKMHERVIIEYGI